MLRSFSLFPSLVINYLGFVRSTNFTEVSTLKMNTVVVLSYLVTQYLDSWPPSGLISKSYWESVRLAPLPSILVYSTLTK